MKYIYFLLGVLAMGIGCIGIALPILPTTPFLLVALYCFTRSSGRAGDWFMSTNIYKNHIHDFVQKKSMKLKTKIMILSFASTMLIIVTVMMQNLHGRIFMGCLIAFKYYYFIFRIKTI